MHHAFIKKTLIPKPGNLNDPEFLSTRSISNLIDIDIYSSLYVVQFLI